MVTHKPGLKHCIAGACDQTRDQSAIHDELRRDSPPHPLIAFISATNDGHRTIMVKFHESSFSHDYPFPTVTLAYFLRYPNPFSTHVLSTDVIQRHYDPTTQRLYTARLHLKRSKIPSALLNLLPKSILGVSASSDGSGTSQSYILERSVVDVKEGIMITESRNLELTGILMVVERQLYRKPGVDLAQYFRSYKHRPGFKLLVPEYGTRRSGLGGDGSADGTTDVSTKVELYSRLGQRIKERALAAGDATMGWGGGSDDEEEVAPQRVGFFKSWTTNSIQRSIEAIGLRRTERAVPKSKEGMNVVLGRLRQGGLVAVLEGMRMDRELAFGTEPTDTASVA